MRHIVSFTLVLTAALAFGCGDKKDNGTASGKPAESAASKVSYDKIDQLVANAKTSDDFLDIVMECGSLEIDFAANGSGKLAEDATYIEHCRVAPEQARAKLAIAESNPAEDKMSVHCLTSSMNLEELVNAGVQAEQMKQLMAQVNEACGI